MTLDLSKIGYERYKILIRTKNMSEKKEREFIEYTRMHPYSLYYSKSIGQNDVELEFIVRDSNHLREVLEEFKMKFENIIKSQEILKIYKEFILDFYPG